MDQQLVMPGDVMVNGSRRVHVVCKCFVLRERMIHACWRLCFCICMKTSKQNLISFYCFRFGMVFTTLKANKFSPSNPSMPQWCVLVTLPTWSPLITHSLMTLVACIIICIITCGAPRFLSGISKMRCFDSMLRCACTIVLLRESWDKEFTLYWLPVYFRVCVHITQEATSLCLPAFVIIFVSI